MLLLLSPAKSLDFTPAPECVPSTDRSFIKETTQLARTARRLRRAELRRLMSISPDLADLNWSRFQAFDAESMDGVQAAFAFDGDVYAGLRARDLDPDALSWAQDHVRILSGLYGVLRPLDRIQPYRLEMGTRLKTRRGSDLYDFWGDRIARRLRAASEQHADRTIVNLASKEYFAAVDRKALKRSVLDVRFLEEKDGEARILSLFAKIARGMMARWAAAHRIDRADALRAFDLGGYRFCATASSEQTWTFSRPQPAPVARRAA